jgi:hypothetical protein
MVEQSMWEFGRASDAEALEMTVTISVWILMAVEKLEAKYTLSRALRT